MQILEKIDKYLNEATNIKKLKDSLSKLFNITTKSMFFENNVMEIVEVFQGPESYEKADKFINKIKSVLKTNNLKRKNVTVDTMYDVVETYTSSKGDLVAAIEREDVGDKVHVYCNLYKMR